MTNNANNPMNKDKLRNGYKYLNKVNNTNNIQ